MKTVINKETQEKLNDLKKALDLRMLRGSIAHDIKSARVYIESATGGKVDKDTIDLFLKEEYASAIDRT